MGQNRAKITVLQLLSPISQKRANIFWNQMMKHNIPCQMYKVRTPYFDWGRFKGQNMDKMTFSQCLSPITRIPVQCTFWKLWPGDLWAYIMANYWIKSSHFTQVILMYVYGEFIIESRSIDFFQVIIECTALLCL